MSTIDEINQVGDNYLRAYTLQNPVFATELGLPGVTALPDYTPDGYQGRRELAASTLAALAKVEPSDLTSRTVYASMQERLSTDRDLLDSQWWAREVSVIQSPQHEIKEGLDLMPKDSAKDWEAVLARLEAVSTAIAGYQESLQYGLSHGDVPAAHQVTQAARLASLTGGTPDDPGYFSQLVSTCQHKQLGTALARAADKAASAYHDLAAFLTSDYLTHCSPEDGVGEETWKLMCRRFNGREFDPRDAYDWGWEELARIVAEQHQEAAKIAPGLSLEQVFSLVAEDESRSVVGTRAFLTWNQNFLDQAVAALNGEYFDIAPAICHVEAMIAPPGGAAAPYYTGPSQDLSRPGRTWFPMIRGERVPLWDLVSTMYHEGVPGHHLQIGTITALGDRLGPFPRILGATSGHVEGWALYAERLMDELGFLEDPVYRLGMLSSQAMRAVRVVIDIGLHLGYSIPTSAPGNAPQQWTRSAALDYFRSITGAGQAFAESEIDRYLGYPAQATSYKLGERVWLNVREQVKKARGRKFSLKDFHRDALELGFVGLDSLEEALVTPWLT